jgi:hypothetical protein
MPISRAKCARAGTGPHALAYSMQYCYRIFSLTAILYLHDIIITTANFGYQPQWPFRYSRIGDVFSGHYIGFIDVFILYFAYSLFSLIRLILFRLYIHFHCHYATHTAD